MRARSITWTPLLGALAVAVCVAADPNMGTWKLNEANSTLSPGTSKNDTVVYTAVGDKVKITVDGTDAFGKPVHSEWTGKFDGKDYPVTGNPTSDMRSYRRVDDRTLALIAKQGGKVTGTGRSVVSADGRTRTVTLSGRDARGNTVTSTGVYDRQ